MDIENTSTKNIQVNSLDVSTIIHLLHQRTKMFLQTIPYFSLIHKTQKLLPCKMPLTSTGASQTTFKDVSMISSKCRYDTFPGTKMKRAKNNVYLSIAHRLKHSVHLNIYGT